ncbi:hypothetical protein MRX96_032232 [Rhipicephalus microplus]
MRIQRNCSFSSIFVRCSREAGFCVSLGHPVRAPFVGSAPHVCARSTMGARSSDSAGAAGLARRQAATCFQSLTSPCQAAPVAGLSCERMPPRRRRRPDPLWRGSHGAPLHGIVRCTSIVSF